MESAPRPSGPPRRRVFARGTDEFTRVVTFSDAVFAIAMTLLVVGIGIPTLTDGDSVSELADALNDDLGSFISFFISFAVIGRYWVAHHEFVARLRGIDRGVIGLNLIYLAFPSSHSQPGCSAPCLRTRSPWRPTRSTSRS